MALTTQFHIMHQTRSSQNSHELNSWRVEAPCTLETMVEPALSSPEPMAATSDQERNGQRGSKEGGDGW